VQEIGGVEFAVYDESDSASGGLRSRSKSYRAVQNNKCYRIENSVTWRDIGFYKGATTGDSATQEEISEQEKLIEKQVNMNNQIVSSFRFVE